MCIIKILMIHVYFYRIVLFFSCFVFNFLAYFLVLIHTLNLVLTCIRFVFYQQYDKMYLYEIVSKLFTSYKGRFSPKQMLKTT